MKPTFKMTALSILVAFGVAACGSSSKGSPAANNDQPQTNTNQVQPKPQAKPQPQAEQPQAKQPAAEQPKAEEAKPNPSNYVLDKDGREWRGVHLSGSSLFGDISTKFGTNTSAGLIADFADFPRGLLDQYPDYLVDLDKLSGSKLGMYQGDINTENDLAPKDGSSIKHIQYLFENQPYSSYGILTADNGDTKAFAFGLKTGVDGTPEYSVGSTLNFDFSNPLDFVKKGSGYIPSVLGTATYKGKLISAMTKGKEGELTKLEPKVDGEVTLTANFDKNVSLSTISGEATSERLGKTIKLYNSSILSGDMSTAASDARVVGDNSFTGDYAVSIHGPNAEDAVGRISLVGDNVKYQAAFGAQKQPK